MALTDIPVGAMPISGSLDFGSVPAADDYMGAYTNALNLNKQNYNNIISGYQSTASAQQQAAQGILSGYGSLSSDVLGRIEGTDAAERQAITDRYAAEAGKQSQGLISRGLGNTTVANSIQRGLLADKSKSNIQLSNQMAQLMANYQASIGQAGLNYANQANMQRTALSQDQLKFMNSVNSPYPDAKKYQELAMMKGAARGGAAGAAAAMGSRGGGGGGQMSRGSMLGGGSGGSNRVPGEMPRTVMPLGLPGARQRAQEPLTSFGGEPGGAAMAGAMGGYAAGDTGLYESTSGDYPGYAEQDQSGGQSWADQYQGWEGFDSNDYVDQAAGSEDPYGGYYDSYEYSQGDEGDSYYTYDDGSYDYYDQGGDYGGYYGADDSFQGDDWYD